MEINSQSTHYLDYIDFLNNEIVQIIALSKQNFTQLEKSKISGVSLRTILNFESLKSDNLYLYWIYKEIFAKEHKKTS